ncbi:hypothetical protein APED_25350 [Acanthopleuribacter pedis]
MKRIFLLTMVAVSSLFQVNGGDNYECITLSAGGDLQCTVCQISTVDDNGNKIFIGNVVWCR